MKKRSLKFAVLMAVAMMSLTACGESVANDTFSSENETKSQESIVENNENENSTTVSEQPIFDGYIDVEGCKFRVGATLGELIDDKHTFTESDTHSDKQYYPKDAPSKTEVLRTSYVRPLWGSYSSDIRYFNLYTIEDDGVTCHTVGQGTSIAGVGVYNPYKKAVPFTECIVWNLHNIDSYIRKVADVDGDGEFSVEEIRRYLGEPTTTEDNEEIFDFGDYTASVHYYDNLASDIFFQQKFDEFERAESDPMGLKKMEEEGLIKDNKFTFNMGLNTYTIDLSDPNIEVDYVDRYIDSDEYYESVNLKYTPNDKESFSIKFGQCSQCYFGKTTRTGNYYNKEVNGEWYHTQVNESGCEEHLFNDISVELLAHGDYKNEWYVDVMKKAISLILEVNNEPVDETKIIQHEHVFEQ